MGLKCENSMCIFCFKSSNSKLTGVQNSKFLKIFSRYLNVDCSSSNAKWKGEFVTFCEDCSGLGESFCELYFQLETIGLQLNWRVERIHEVMLCAGRIPSRFSAFRKQFEGDRMMSLVQELRKDLIQSCKLKLELRQPTVYVEKLANMTIKTEQISPSHFQNLGSLEAQESFTVDDTSSQVLENDSDTQEIEVDGGDYNERIIKLEEVDSVPEENRVMNSSEVVIEKHSAAVPNKTIELPSASTTRKPEEDVESEKKSLRSILKCTKCTKTFSNQPTLHLHLKTHADEEDTNEPEPELDDSDHSHDEDYQKMEEDEDEHSNSEEDNMECSQSEVEEEQERIVKRKRSKKSLTKTNLVDDDDPLIFQKCEVCLKVLECEAALEKHRAVVHDLKKIVRCHSCKKLLKYHRSLVDHRTHPKKCKRRCFTTNPEDLKPAAAPLFPYQASIFGNKFCPVEGCYEVFAFEEKLDIHLKTHGEWKCSTSSCSEQFTKAHELAWHELTQHNPKSSGEATVSNMKIPNKTNGEDLAKVNYHCSRCDFAFDGKRPAVAHFVHEHLGVPKLPTNVKKISKQCHICKKVFSPQFSEKRIQNHVQVYHNVDGMDPAAISTCGICKAVFTKTDFLSRHLKLEHGQTKVHNCSHCQMEFRTLPEFRKHLSQKHKEKASGLAGAFECEICKERMNNEYNFKRHMKKHEPKPTGKPFICDLCGAAFAHRNGLYGHTNLVHKPLKRTFCCEKCGKVFKTNTKLKQHTSYTHTDSSEWKFVCPEEGCGRRCWSRQKLGEHLRTHTKQRPFDKAVKEQESFGNVNDS